MELSLRKCEGCNHLFLDWKEKELRISCSKSRIFPVMDCEGFERDDIGKLRLEYIKKVEESGMDLWDFLVDLVDCLNKEELQDRINSFKSGD